MDAALEMLARLDAAQGGNVAEVASAVAEKLGVQLEAVQGLVHEEFSRMRKRMVALEANQTAMLEMLNKLRQTLPYLYLPLLTHPTCPCL